MECCSLNLFPPRGLVECLFFIQNIFVFAALSGCSSSEGPFPRTEGQRALGEGLSQRWCTRHLPL